MDSKEPQGDQAFNLAHGMMDAVREAFPSGSVEPSVLTNSCAQLLAAYLVQLAPPARAIYLNDFVEALLTAINSNVDEDIVCGACAVIDSAITIALH